MTKMNVNQRIKYHTKKRDLAPSYLVRPDVSDNDVRVIAMYHNNCIEKAKGNSRFFKKNSELFKMAVNYAMKHKNKSINPKKTKKGYSI